MSKKIAQSGFTGIRKILDSIRTQTMKSFSFDEIKTSSFDDIYSIQKLQFYYHNKEKKIDFGWVTNPDKARSGDDCGTLYIPQGGTGFDNYLFSMLSINHDFVHEVDRKLSLFGSEFLSYTHNRWISWNYGKSKIEIPQRQYDHLGRFIQWFLNQADNYFA